MAERRTLTDADILAGIPAARARERQARQGGMRARSARYSPRDRRVLVEMTNGHLFGFPVSSVAALRGAGAATLARVRLDPGGAALHWDELDVDLDIPGLLVAAMGGDARRELARAAGSATSARKAEAARRNGERGGRPRKR